MELLPSPQKVTHPRDQDNKPHVCADKEPKGNSGKVCIMKFHCLCHLYGCLVVVVLRQQLVTSDAVTVSLT